MANGVLDLIGTPTLVSTGSNKLVIGTTGAASLVFMTNGVQRMSIDENGATTLAASVDLALANNDYLLAANSTSGNNSLLKSDTSDNTILNAPTGKTVQFAINGTTAARVDSSGVRVNAASLDSDITDKAGTAVRLYVEGSSSGADQVVVSNIGANASGATISAFKTRATAGNANTIVNASDAGLILNSYFSDGANYINGGQLKFFVDGTPGTTDMPTGLTVRLTADGGSSLLDRWTFKATGNLEQDATNGGSVVLTAPSTFVGQPAATGLTAAGTTISDALQLTAVFNNVTTTASNTGVKLLDALGTAMIIRNAGANALKVYPPNSSGTINGDTAGDAISVAAGAFAVMVKVAANTWISMVGAASTTT